MHSRGVFSSLLVILVIFCIQVKCDRTSRKIYYDVKSIGACFRRLNATHTIGCASSRSGNVGVVHVIVTDDDLNWVINSGTHAPYSVVMTPYMFIRKNVDSLRDSGKINGILVDFTNDTEVPEPGFSPDDTCPNRNSGIYAEDETYRDCQNVTWNADANSMMFEDFGFPIVAVRNGSEIEFVIKNCFEQFNKPAADGSPPEYPLCAAELKDAMDAAKDTPTCVRRSKLVLNLNPDVFCDALGDFNVYALSRTVVNATAGETFDNQSVIMATTRMDGFSLFNTIYPNADSPVTGVITLLAAAEAFGKMNNTLPEDHRPVMFAFFQGEAFDYIGSSRMVYDMAQNKFPQSIGLNHLKHILEVSQVGMPSEGKVWMHTDPISMKNEEVKLGVEELIDLLRTQSVSSDITVVDTPQVQPLPPASIQSFLRHINISGIVLTDHQAEFTNKYYNSRFDNTTRLDMAYPDDVNDTFNYVTPAAQQLSDIATLVARSLYKLSTDNDPPADMEANVTTVANLLYCFLVRPNCSLFKEVLDEEDGERLSNIPYGWYVGVSMLNSPGTHQVTKLTRQLLARYLGNPIDSTQSKCSDLAKDDLSHEYIYMRGPNLTGVCVQTTSNLTLARSPAFEIDDYDWSSGEFSSWSESRWTNDAFGVRVFLIPSRDREIATVTSGVILLVFSLIGSYFLHKRGRLLFRPMHMF